MSVNETGPVLVAQHDTFRSHDMAKLDTHTANLGGLELSDSTDWTASYDQMAEANIAGDGLSTEAFVVSWTPVTLQGWEYYVVDMQPTSDELAFADEYSTSDQLALADEELDFFIPADYVALMSTDELGLAQDEDGTILSLSPEPFSEGPG